MRYVVLEDFNGLVNLIVDFNSGMTKVFDTYEEAQEEINKCQNGKIINLD